MFFALPGVSFGIFPTSSPLLPARATVAKPTGFRVVPPYRPARRWRHLQFLTVTNPVLLDAGVVTRCRRRVHLEHDPTMIGRATAPPDPAQQQRSADASAHRRKVAERLAASFGDAWTAIDGETAADRETATVEALRARAAFVWNAHLPTDSVGGRRGRIDLVVRVSDGYVPVLVVRHKITDPGSGARTSTLDQPWPRYGTRDPARKTRPQPRDQFRLVHAREMLRAAGFGASGRAVGGSIGMDADVVVWHDLEAPSWPGGRTALTEYAARFTDRLAVAEAARADAQALAQPSRIVDCRTCPWWPVCEERLLETRDVSLVLRGEDAVTLRQAGVRTVDDLAARSPDSPPPVPTVSTTFPDAVALARAWLADLTMVRRVTDVLMPRADVEVDVDMESFGDSGAYLWGSLLSGADVGEAPGYRAFATWEPLPTVDEARSFAEFWQWLTVVRARAAEAGLTFRAYCYNELAENRWLLSSTDRFAGRPGIPLRAEVQAFIDSDQWIDMFRIVSDTFLCARGKGLKTIAPVAGFAWRDPEAGGENSMRWYRDAVGLDGLPTDDTQRQRLLAYNEDDVLATRTLREWMSSPAVHDLPFIGDL
jgi:predicted RecB family nuclease